MPDNTSTGEQTENTKEFINDLYACVDENVDYNNNCGNYKISIFLTPKTKITKESMFNFNNVLKLEYNKHVSRIVLEDTLYSIGLQGYMDVDNTNSWLDKILTRSNQLYVVINITEYTNINDNTNLKKPFIKYEPYIFDISYVENINSPQQSVKTLRIGLMDCVTSIIEQHSIASVIQFNRNIVTATSYKRVFQYIHAYIKDHINTNLNNKFEWKKDILYNESCMFLDDASSGNDVTTDLSWLVKDTFGRIPRNATISEALNYIYRDACTTMYAPTRFKEQYQDIGNVLIPFYFKEEYPDRYFLYTNLWKNGQDTNQINEAAPVQSAPAASTQPGQPTAETPADSTTPNTSTTASTTTPAATNQQQQEESWTDQLKQMTKNIQNNNRSEQISLYNKTYGGNSEYLLYRQMTMRDIYMPFVLAFGADNYGCVFETFNPPKTPEQSAQQETVENQEISIFPINGESYGEVQDMQYDPIRINELNKLWKNVIFIACSNGSTSGDSTLIFFSWFYDYFTNVFLNESIDENVIRKRFACACPAFHKMMINEDVRHGQATEADAKGFVNKVDEHNSYTYATRTQDTVNECMRLMGKNIASFVLANDSYTFSIYGNLRRRPNEIVKYCFNPNNTDGSSRAMTVATGLFDVNQIYLYVAAVTHEFVGNVYKNTLKTFKFMEESKVEG